MCFNDLQKAIWSAVQAKKRVFLLIQSEHLSINKYYEEFKALVAVVETYGGTFVKLGMIKKDQKRAHRHRCDPGAGCKQE